MYASMHATCPAGATPAKIYIFSDVRNGGVFAPARLPIRIVPNIDQISPNLSYFRK